MSNVMEMSVEQFMDGIKAILREEGIDDYGMADSILVDAYNKYREEVRNGKSMEQLIPFFRKVANDVFSAVEGQRRMDKKYWECRLGAEE